MVLSDDKIKEFMKRLLQSRMRLLCTNGFYGLLLMHVTFSLDETRDTAATDGERIYFGPEFLDSISDTELDFVIMHEIMHVVLQHLARKGERDMERFNIAADIVVNSEIMNSFGGDEKKISVHGEPAMHLTPDGQEGYLYTAEQVYEMLPCAKQGNASAIYSSGVKQTNRSRNSAKKKTPGKKSGGNQGTYGFRDDHTMWKNAEEDGKLQDAWVQRLKEACAAMEIRDPDNSRGLLPAFAERFLKELKNPQIDWRKVLNEFVQEEIMDYSFTPPDRRFDGGDFFLPDFNEKEDRLENILFMIDTSGSMSDEMITAAYSEIKGAIDQFDGKLTGWLGFFDAAVIPPKPFSDEEELRIIRPEGGGGTDFNAVFDYIRKNMQENLPASIIILTDGYAPFPPESAAMGIPVLWLLNNETVKPKWGRIARISL